MLSLDIVVKWLNTFSVRTSAEESNYYKLKKNALENMHLPSVRTGVSLVSPFRSLGTTNGSLLLTTDWAEASVKVTLLYSSSSRYWRTTDSKGVNVLFTSATSACTIKFSRWQNAWLSYIQRRDTFHIQCHPNYNHQTIEARSGYPVNHHFHLPAKP